MRTLLLIIFGLNLCGCYSNIDTYYNTDKKLVEGNTNSILNKKEIQIKGRFNIADNGQIVLTLDIHNSSNTIIDSVDFSLQTDRNKEFKSWDKLFFNQLGANLEKIDSDLTIKQRTANSNNTTATFYFNSEAESPDSVFIKFKVTGQTDSLRFSHIGKQTYIKGIYRQPFSR